MSERPPCGNCKTYWRHNDTIGCCSACGRCYRGLRAFEAHQVGPRDERGRLTCLDPATATFAAGLKRAGEPIFTLGPRSGDRGPLWRLTPSESQGESQRDWVARVRQAK